MTDPSYLTYPVIIKAVRADWLLTGSGEEDEDENNTGWCGCTDQRSTGLDFLRDLMNVQDRRIFESDYVSIVIQFFYQRFRDEIIKKQLPLYILHLVAVFCMIFLNDWMRSELEDWD